MTSPMLAPVPGAAFDAFLGDRAPADIDRAVWTPSDGPLPALFLSHGAPPLFDDPLWIDELFRWSQSLPKPTGIVMVSAHWEEAPVTLSATEPGTPLVYDFAGFAPRYFTMTYPTPDAGDLGRRVAGALEGAETVHRSRRGLDHGAWVPLKVLYPWGDVPVVQVSLPSHDPFRLLALGARLEALRHEGVLVIGSGFLTHGLPFLSQQHFVDNVVPGWSAEFAAWAAEALGRGDIEALAAFHQAPGMPYAHPTVEHFVPLFVTLGAGGAPNRPTATVVDGFQFGLSKLSVQTGPTEGAAA
jgi:4,5-DOPA dioxygenase extradiol